LFPGMNAVEEGKVMGEADEMAPLVWGLFPKNQ
jgi:hypothetical protein